ncbi:MAG: ParB-like nuclease domain-containing protein [Methanobrevibacter sp.]|nr:ParB-like nuclease domain-containing protein [Methanobrevibacter sp.]
MKKFTLEDVKEHTHIVDINRVCFNTWNPKIKRTSEFEKVKDSIRMNGQMMPIIVRSIDNRDYDYEVLDGEQRLTAMLDLGFNEVWITDLGTISDEEAKSKTIWAEMAVPFDKDKLGALLIELKDQIELPYSDEEIEVMAGIEFDDTPADDFEDDTMTLISFGVNVLPENKQILKDKFKQLREDYECSDNAIIMAAIEMMSKEENQDDIKQVIKDEQAKELEFGV